MKNASFEALPRFLLGLSLCLLLAGASVAATITQLRTEQAEDGIYLSATVQFELPAVVEDALLKGIPAVFVFEADIYRDRWYWTNAHLTNAVRTLRLAYQPLTRRWRVNVVSGLISSASGLRATLSQNYETLPEALSAIRHVARWRIAEAVDVDAEAAYLLDLSFRLDLSQLPRPFQIGVAGQRDWTIAARMKERMRLERAAPALAPAPAGSAASASLPAVSTPAVPVSAVPAVSAPAVPAASSAEGPK